jgi:hypothetical protein
MKKIISLTALLTVIPACDEVAPGGDPDRGEVIDRGVGKADGSASCVDTCGAQAPAGCWCDDQCAAYGDCCADKAAVCDGQAATCEGSCGGKAPDGCWCDDQCMAYGDCCTDFAQACGDPCADVQCELPEAHCDGDDLVEYTDATCVPESGDCEADPTTTACEFGCADGACNPPPAESDDPFDPASCQGEPITMEQMIALFESGASVADLGTYRVDRRTAECTALTGCGAWNVETQIVRTMWAGSTSMPWRELVGTARLRVEGEDIELRLESAHGYVPTSPYGSRCSLGDTVACGNFSYLSSQQWGGSGGYFNYSSTLTVGSPSENVALRGVLTDHCLRLSHRVTSDTRDDEVALLVRF